MEETIGITKFALVPAVVVVVLAFMGIRVAADGPVAKFPGFIPFSVSSEGVAVDKIGNVYISIRDNGRGKILRFTPTGESSLFADIGVGDAGGLAVDAKGDVYVAMGAGPDQGVYQVGRNGKSVRLTTHVCMSCSSGQPLLFQQAILLTYYERKARR